jgi:hypothetical protein
MTFLLLSDYDIGAIFVVNVQQNVIFNAGLISFTH